MLSEYPLALDNLKYIEKTNVSSVTSFLTSTARPFSKYMAVKPKGRNSHYLMGDEREGPPRGQKRTRSKSYKCCPCKCLGAGSHIPVMWREVTPSIVPRSCPTIVRESLSLLGFLLFTGDSLPTRILFLFYKKSAWSSEEKLCGEARNILKRERKWILTSLYSSSRFFLISS